MSEGFRADAQLLPDTSIVMRCGTMSRSRIVVFVHGWGGAASSTWDQFQHLVLSSKNAAWSSWWNEADLYFFNYPSRRFSISEHTALLERFLSDHVLQSELAVPLFLVGHSMGAVLIRQLVLDCCERKESPYGLPPNLETLVNAEVRLFAPAMLGFKPSSYLGYAIGVAREIPLLKTWVAPLTQASPVIRQLDPKDNVIVALQTRTEQMARTHGHHALRAQVVFGEDEKVVERGKYVFDDIASPVPDRDHHSVCKPNLKYSDPFQFVRFGAHYVASSIAK